MPHFKRLQTSRAFGRRAITKNLATLLGAVSLIVVSLVTNVDVVRAESERTGKAVLLATTTSVRDSGLLDALLPRFRKETGIEVRVIAVGTGAALRMGREGNADLLLTHAPEAEQKLVEDGIVRRRTPFMENYFVLAGPPNDPAGIAATSSPEAALERIAAQRAAWVSRSDDSGTHKREIRLFQAAGLPPDVKWDGLVRTGSGMGQSLLVAGEKRAYILSDIGTFLAFQKRTELRSFTGAADALRNVYSILQLDATKFDHALRTPAAEAFERFLLDARTLQEISAFGVERYGRTLFQPIQRPTVEAAH